MNEKQYNLVGFVSPSDKPFGFLMPIFQTEDDVYCMYCIQKGVHSSEDLSQFNPIERGEIEELIITINCNVSNPEIYAFAFNKNDIIWGDKDDVAKKLQKRIKDLSDFPFIKSEVMCFLGDEKGYLEAIDEATKKLAAFNPKIAKNWKKREYKRVRADIFVDRKKELEQFKEFLAPSFKNYILNIHTNGDGGIGKTQLLLQMQKICKERTDTIFYTKKLIDFYHTEARTKIDVMRLVTESLGKEVFVDFNKKIEVYKQSQDREEIRNLIQELEDIFFGEYFDFEKRIDKIIVLFFDTYEVIQETDFSRWLEQDFFSKLKKNTRIIVSGRNPLDIPSVERMELNPFDIYDTIEFWKQCFKLNNESELEKRIGSRASINKIHTLAKGHPILLALFADWCQLEHNYLRPERIILEIEKEARSKEYPEKFKQERFEMILIEWILKLETPEDIAITTMAFAYRRMTTEMFSYIANIEIDESRNLLLEKLKPLSFIKYKDEDMVLLHDEMRDLVVRHYWEKHDPKTIERKNISHKIILYYNKLLGNSNLFAMEKAILHAERLYYQLYSDIDKGFRDFIRQFDKYLQDYQIYFCDLIGEEIFVEQFYNNLNIEKQLEIDLRRIRLCNEQYLSQEALRLLEGINNRLEKKAILEKNHQFLAYFKHEQGIAYFWLNQFDEAIRNFSDAERAFRKLGLHYDLAQELNWLGYSYYRSGNYKEAEKKFYKSVKTFLNIPMEGLTGNYIAISNVYSNLNPTLRLQGRYYEASVYGSMAVGIAEKVQNDRELARFLIAIGDTYKFSNKSFEAFQAHEKALNIIEILPDSLLKARALMGMALPLYRRTDYIFILEYYLKGEDRKDVIQRFREAYPLAVGHLEYAQKRLEEAKKILENYDNKTIELADLYFYMAEFYTISDDWDNAIKLFKKSEEIANEVHNEYREIDAVVGQIICHYFKGDEENKIQELKERIQKSKNTYHNLLGKMEIILGNFAYDQYLKDKDPESLKESVKRYVIACHHMYEFSRVSRNRFYMTFRILVKRLGEMTREFLPFVEDIESFRDIWNYDEDERKVCQRYNERFDDVIDFAIKRIKGFHDKKEQHEYIAKLKERIDQCIRYGKEESRFAHFYAKMLLQIQIDFGTFFDQADAFYTLGYAYDANNIVFEARKNYAIALEIIQKVNDNLEKSLLLKARILISQAAILYSRGEYTRIMEHNRSKDFDKNISEFVAKYQPDIKQALENFESAERILTQLSERFSENQEMLQKIAFTHAHLEFRWAQYLLLTKGNAVDIERRFNEAIVKADEGNNHWRQMNAIVNLIGYYYFSGQWNDKSSEINVLRNQFVHLVKVQSFPELLARLEVTEGDAKYDQILSDPDNEELIEEAFNHYLLATDYKIKYSEKYFFDTLGTLLDRIAKLPKKSVKILHETIYERLLHNKFPSGKIAEDAYRLVEQCMRIHSELLPEPSDEM